MTQTLKSLFAAMAIASSPIAFGHDASVGSLTIAHPYALPTPPGATTGGAYLTDIANRGDAPDALIGASSPVADQVELHSMRMDGNVMRMRAVPSIAIAPNAHVAMSPGNGYHLMLVGLKKRWVVGDEVPLTLQFQRAGRVDVVLKVQERTAPADMHMHP